MINKKTIFSVFLILFSLMFPFTFFLKFLSLSRFLFVLCLFARTDSVCFPVYPNLMINRYGPWMDTNVVTPTGPNTCVVHFEYLLEAHLLPRVDDKFVEESLEHHQNCVFVVMTFGRAAQVELVAVDLVLLLQLL